ncbi:MAG: carboxypeptidase-like regulatory domain-containing protein, partial [Gemmatimonadaceae bacterium]
RGRVVGPDSQPIANVLITALSYIGGIQKQKRSDKDGRYTIVYPNGEGDYWLQFTTIGFVSRRFEVKRHSDEDVLVANATLSKSQELNAVQVSAAGGKLSLSRNDNFQDVSGSDRSITAGFVVVSPEARGDLVAQASALPGVQFIPGVDGAPDRFSIFGLSGDQNNTTLNGSQQGISKLPREANTSLQLRTGYDVSTGGASGATIAIITNSGTNRVVRPLSLVLLPPQTQLPGPLGASSRYGAISASGRVTGPWRWDRDFYNVSFQFDHRQQDLLNVASGARDALTAAGVANDSVASLLNALSTAHIPYNAAGTGSNTASDAGTFLGTFDWAPKSAASGHALTLTTNAGFNVRGPNALSLTSTPSSLISSKSLNGGLQLRHTNFFGSGTLTESVVSVSGNRSSTSPEFRAPGASVIVSSTFDDSTTTTRALSAGGNSSASTNASFIVGARNMLSRISDNNKHRTKLTSEIALLSSGDEEDRNSLGSFTYQSLDDLRFNRPSSFSRTIGSTDITGHAIVGGLALGDSWRPSGNLQVQYGLRAEADEFLTKPSRNTLLESALGVRNDQLPRKVYLSPRIGFSKTFLDSYTYLRGVSDEMGADNSIISGGIGLFQNTRGADLITPVLAQTGLNAGSVTVNCVGAATPGPDWQSYASSDATIPTTCANGSTTTALGSSAPQATLFARNFVEPRSLRGSLRLYTERLAQHRTTFALSYAYNFNQLGQQDINLRAARQFSLPDEGNRDVYVAPENIDAHSGFASISENRVSSQFGT